MNPLRVRVKMCGMTRLEDVEEAIRLGADALGFIFYSNSARFVSKEQVKKLFKALTPFVDAVAVLVNPERQFVKELIDELPFQLLQFHGDESPEFCEQFHLPFIKALHPRKGEPIQEKMAQYPNAHAFLLDTPSSSARGGTGLSFDWGLIPHKLPKPFILAGGLDAENVLEAVRQCKPYAVDVCSGIEERPGIKDKQKMDAFMNALWDKR